mgnify:CR=1 FL=1
MKTVINIIIASLLLMNVTIAQDAVMLAKGSFDNLKIKGMPLEDLYEIDNGFEELRELGKPLKVDSVYLSAEPKWIYYYLGFTLTFVQFFPTGPELFEVEVTDPEAEFYYSGNNLFENSRQALRNSLGQIELEEISSQLTDSEKFGDGHCYLEYHYSSDVLKRIIFRIDPNL